MHHPRLTNPRARVAAALPGRPWCLLGTIVLGLVGLCGGGFEVGAADPPSDDRALEKSLDDDLFSDLPKPAAPAPAAPGQTPALPETAEPQPKPMPSPLDADLERKLGAGEDVELGAAKSPLLKIGERMRAAEKRLAAQDPGPETQLEQQQIVRDLQLLIDEVERQQQQQAAASSGQPKPMPQPNPQPMRDPQAAAGEPGSAASNDPARESTTRLEEGQVESGDARSRVELIRRAWGHLPAKIREQLQSRGVEEFLPQYEELMENYFKRLAEEGSGRP